MGKQVWVLMGKQVPKGAPSLTQLYNGYHF